MVITQAFFRTLPLAQQAAVLWTEGTLLASRWEGHQTVGLYQMEDYFCELYYNTTSYALLRTRLLVHLENQSGSTTQECD